jgi:hypothetical protein
MVLVSPDWARMLHGGGLSRTDVQAELQRRARTPVDRLPPALRRVAEERCEDRVLPHFAAPEDIVIVVAGGVGIKQTVIHGWQRSSRPVTQVV